MQGSPPRLCVHGLATLNAAAVAAHVKACSIRPADALCAAPPEVPPASPPLPAPSARPSVADLMRSLSLRDPPPPAGSPSSAGSAGASLLLGPAHGTASPPTSEGYAGLSCHSELSAPCSSLDTPQAAAAALPAALHLHALQQEHERQQQQSAASVLLAQQQVALHNLQGGGADALSPRSMLQPPTPAANAGTYAPWPPAQQCKEPQGWKAQVASASLVQGALPGAYGGTEGGLANAGGTTTAMAQPFTKSIWGSAQAAPLGQACGLPAAPALPQQAVSLQQALLMQLPPHLQLQALLLQHQQHQQHQLLLQRVALHQRFPDVRQAQALQRQQQAAARRAHQLAQQTEQDPPEALLGVEGRYQPYCQQVVTERLNTAITAALTTLKLLQAGDNAAEGGYAPGKRFFCSLKEVAKVVPAAKCLIVAPDVRTSPVAHINPVTSLQRILRAADVSGVPVIFALSRRGIGQVFGRDKSMSIVAVMHLEGLEDPYRVMLEEALLGKQLFQQHRPAIAAMPTAGDGPLGATGVHAGAFHAACSPAAFAPGCPPAAGGIGAGFGGGGAALLHAGLPLAGAVSGTYAGY